MGKRKIEDIEDYADHFGQDLSPSAYAYLRDTVMAHSRYIFTRRDGKKQFGYCTNCRSTFRSSLKHGQQVICPECGRDCMVRASGISRKTLVDQGLMVWYEKSLIDPEAITARCVWCVRDYRGDFRKVETTTVTVAAYIFRPGKAVMFKRRFWFNMRNRPYAWGCYTGYYDEGALVSSWEQASKPHPITCSNWPKYYNRESIATAVEGTPFQYSCWEQYDYEDMIRFFGLYAVAPCVEYLTKLRMKALVIGKLTERPTYGSINWKGKTLLSVLKLTKQQFRAIREANVQITFEFLAGFRAAGKDGSNFTLQEVVEIADRFGVHIKEAIDLSASAGTSLRKAAAWAGKQLGMSDDGNHRYYGIANLLDTWKQYLGECRQLNLNMASEAVVMPKSLYNAHQNTLT